MSRRESFTARRRSQLALRVAALEVFEGRHSIGDLSSPLGLALRAVAGAGLLDLVRPRALPAEVRRAPRVDAPTRGHVTTAAAPWTSAAASDGAVLPLAIAPRTRPMLATSRGREGLAGGDWLALAPRDAAKGGGMLAPALPASGASQPMSARGNAAGAVARRGAITPLRVAPPRLVEDAAIPPSLAGPSLLAAPGFGPGDVAGADAGAGAGGGDGDGDGDGTGAGGGGGGTYSSFGGEPGEMTLDPSLLLADSGAQASLSFTNFPLYTLDWNNGVVLFDGAHQIGIRGGSVDLRAQARDATGFTYSWNVTGLNAYATISGATNTYKLTFTWKTNIIFPNGASWVSPSVSLTVTDGLSRAETQTYTFDVPAGVSTSTTPGSWPATLAPGAVLPGSAAFASHDAAVDAVTGALETYVAMPSYGPNFPGLVFAYDSLAADPRPLVVVHHTLPTTDLPTKTSAQLTFNGTAGSTYYYDTSQFSGGAVAQFALQADATALATGRYDYTATVADYRTTTATSTYAGTTTLVSDASSAFGAGWSLAGLGAITAASGGVVLAPGAGEALWFTTGATSGGTTSYASPAGEFSTLAKNTSTGAWTRTLPDGTTELFDSGGRQTAVVDRNGLRVTFAYDGSGKLTTITDPYAKVTTFAYDGSGKLATVTDPANRVTTFTVSGGALTGVTMADGSTWGYAYDASRRLTQLTDPRTQRVTVAYDAAGRVGTVTRPDNSAETFAAYQVRGYDTSGTSGSPAPAILLAEARGTHADPNGNVTDLRVDWRGQGRANQVTDAIGRVATADLDANGLATVTIDRLSRIERYSYDAKGNVTGNIHQDTNRVTFTYNGFSQVTEAVDERNNRTTFTYDGEGNLTGVRDALSNRTTITYTANGMVESVKDARSNLTTFQYDAQDRLTTITYPAVGGSSATTQYAYDAYGNVATVTDERGLSTTYAYDALNRATGQTDALSNRTTFTYDSGGNLTVAQLPTPAGETARTTTVAYDNVNRPTTITAPLSRVTVLGYDSGGRLVTTKDPLDRLTTATYDALDRVTVVTSPQEGATVRRVTTTYDAEGQVLTQADHLNRVTTFTYNNRGWVSTATDPVGKTVTYAYTATGRLSTVSKRSDGISDPLGTDESYTYDALDRPESVVDALNHRTTTVYDAVGNVIARVDGLGNRTSFTYDARNRLATAKDPLSNVTTYGYDAAGNVTSVTNPLGKTTQYAYDNLDRATTITDALTGVVALSFDAAGRNTVLVDPVGNRTTFAYDAADRVTTQVDALGTVTFSYDLGDQLTARTDRLGRQVSFAYDSGGRQTNEWWLSSGGTVERRITFTYDAADQLTQVTDPDATLSYTYGSGGALLTARTSGGGSGQPDVTLSYGYDPLGNRTSMTDNLASVGRTTYAYDAAHRLTTITRSVGGTEKTWVKFSYDDADRRTGVERSVNGSGTKVLSTIAYDNASRVTTITHGVSGGAALATFAYGYDSGGRVTTERNAEGLATYSYDDTDQLTGVDRPVGQSDESFGYDLAGNRNTTGYTTIGGNRMTASPGYTYGYDAEGNMTSRVQLNGAGTSDDVTTTFAYDHRNRMTGARTTTNAGVETMRATYAYEALGRRIRVQADADGAGAGGAVTTWTVYDGVNTYADVDSAGTLQTRYLYGLAVDELLARTDSGGRARGT